MKSKLHQRRASRQIKDILRKYGICILAGEPRSGKTLSFLLVCLNLKKVLIVTTKKAKNSIENDIKYLKTNCQFVVTNYHQVKNLKEKDFDLVIIDEFHRYISNASPKKSKIWLDMYQICYNLPIIFSSGTPTPETKASIFHPLSLSCKSPFEEKNFKDWFVNYGYPYQIKINGYYINKYDKCNNEKINKKIEHLIVKITRTDAGIDTVVEDKIHNIELTSLQNKIYNEIDKNKIYSLDENYDIVCDSAIKILQKKHQIAGGFVNANNLNEEVKNFKLDTNKVSYIKNNFDVNKSMIVAYYINEQKYLQTKFPHVASITKICEGVDLSHFENLIIYSFSFQAVTYEQIKIRQVNMNKKIKNIYVHFLLSGIDKYVYRAVKSKKNFTANWFTKQI